MGTKQSGTDYGRKGEAGEREPKGATSSDNRSERHAKVKNGVGMGKEDDGRAAGGPERGEFNTGRSESTCYSHKRIPHEQDK